MTGDREHTGEPIAIVGSACRFPGDATTPSKLWELLREPRDVLSEIPDSRFSTEAFYHPDGLHHGTTNVRHSYLLSEDHRLFDAQFFGTKPVEANSIDPQQRLLLETVYEGLETAGIPMEKLQGSNTGVYVGLMTNDYADMLGRDVQKFPTYFASGTARSILSNRVSYFFDWRGPSMTIDTACSSSLIALHQAVQSLRSGETNVAVAAGTNLLLGPEQYIAESKLKMLSPTGRSRMWDKGANGYARGDGIAAIILKPLNAALADGDHIECIVRETGANQDGRTKGITMPNPVAQAQLIRTTYARAGLDLSKSSDRPQYFEAHGTGTPAGDPVEAEAISTAFFGKTAKYHRNVDQEPPLYVGSIKTVIGHTEGTAGLAAVLKASLALQKAVIPPNLLLDELSPTVLPFYDNLEILDAAKEWPPLPDNTPRRASVNSFGFGGANAHAILEAFDACLPAEGRKMTSSHSVGALAFNFSASSEKSLLASIAAYSAYLQSHGDINIRDLSWTLNCRRSTLPVRLSVSASNLEQLIGSLEQAVHSEGITPSTQTANVRNPKLLGVFTGQGAQWTQMGAELLASSLMFSDCIARLDRSLQELPTEHRPVWSLREEILKDKTSSRIGEAAFSQPLCTAIQIALVQLLHAANLKFAAVVGHSSGEIAAAYAAGYINEQDAIRIAYYRGWSLQYASDRDGSKGAMMAAGTSFEDAKDLCEMPSLENRICVAASNSSASVTLSGDIDAIEEAREILEDEKKFARLLKVDKAYHSHHMVSCSSPYIAAIRKCGIKIQRPPSGSATWISSVYGENIENVNDNLADTYWSNNMVNPVLFSQAITYAVGASGPFDMALEVGPHPALKGPAMQTIQEVSGQTLPYTGTLSRGKIDSEAFASALGTVWTALGESVVDFAGFERMGNRNTQTPELIKGLPSYSWDHDRIYWHESRLSATMRTEKEAFHSLLGVKCPDGTDKELRWRNYLHPREVPWLAHHQVQGQMVFPAAGYISAAVEAVMQKYKQGSVQLIDFHDVIIGQALVLEENGGVETIFRLSIDQVHDDCVSASFTCHSDANKGSASMSLHASATLRIITGDPNLDILPPRGQPHGSFLDLETDRFYNSVAELGFGYTGPFQALSSLCRKMDEASGLIAVPMASEDERPLIIHPASLDGAIQSIMLAYSFPGDGRLRTLYLPTRIDRLRINPTACVALGGPGADLPFHSAVTDARFAELSGDVDIFSVDGKKTLIQLEGLHTTPLSPLTSINDIPFFTEVIWDVDRPIGRDLKLGAVDMLAEDCSAALDLERVAHFYFKQLKLSLQQSDRANATWNHTHLLSYVEHCLSSVANGTHKFTQPEWASDTIDTIAPILNRHSDKIDIKLMCAVGENLPAVIRGDKNLLEILMQDHMLAEFHAKTLGIDPYLDAIAETARQISHRYPHLNALEIGAGAGATSERVICAMGSAFASYTYSDIHDSQFDDARERFSQFQSRMAFKLLDIERNIEEQSYEESCFDLVIAPLALYATRKLETTLSNVRRLLKPGGYLVMLELTNPEVMRFALILGGLPGWWLGYEEGRTLSPCISEHKWEELMQRVGFSGFEASSVSSSTTSPLPFSVMVTQAVDHRVNFLRNPLSPNHIPLGVDSLTIIGGKTSLTATLVAEITTAVRQHYGNIHTASSLDDLVSTQLPVMGSVISLIELDGPVLQDMSPANLKTFQELFKQSKNVLWLGHGAQGDNPYGNMFAGVQRTLAMEMAHLHIHFLNLHSLVDADALIIATKLLHLEASEIWDQSGQLDGVLWTNEREVLLQNGHLKVPRFRLDSHRNDRYNSSRRLIIKEIDRAESAVTIQPTEMGYQVEEKALRSHPSFLDNVEIEVTHCLLRAVRIGATHSLFLVIGRKRDTSEHMVALSHTLDSQIHVPHSLAVRCGDSDELGIRSMLTLYSHFLALSMLQQLQSGKTLAVLDPDFSFFPVLTKYANEKGVQLVLLTTKEGQCSWPWIRIHPNSTRREILTKLPRNISRLVNMGGESAVLSVLKTCLPPNSQFESEATLTENCSQSPYDSDRGQLATNFQTCWTKVQYDLMPVNSHKFVPVGLHDLIHASKPSAEQSLVAWGQPRLPVQVRPATKQIKFSKDKTYWLVGLTGGLGLSLCQWMMRQGARYIALSSRNPNIDDQWLQRMATNGCTVRVFSNDITNRESVQATHRHISETMPPIAGVAQGAMVLQDTMFIDLDLPRLKKVLDPKVEGSILLDELFPKDTLEFMVFFSSMAAMTGNPGQAAYNAANMFMASLAAQRRNRGLAGHAINIGAIVGNGYVTRELNMGQQSYLYRVGHSWMSEQDFHEVFAEGVLTCLDRRGSAELCCGLRIDDDESKSWVSNPMFQHLVYKSSNLVVVDKKGKSGVLVKTRLFEATSKDEVIEILQDGFVLKLQSALQADPTKPMLDMSPDELGVDSLVAVDLRSWFLKELGVDMPVLKIFNAASIRELLASAADVLPEGLIPNLTAGEEAVDPGPEQPNGRLVVTSPTVDDIASETRNESADFKYALPDASNAYSGSSATSINTGDSNSENDPDSSSSVFTDDIETHCPKRELQRSVPMSYGQSRFWFLEHMVEDKTAFNITPTFELCGRLRIDDFAKAIQAVGQHHEALRTFFFTDNEQNHMQGVWTKSTLRLEHVEISDEGEVEDASRQMKEHAFNLADGEIMRVQLLSLSPERHWILFGFHHINMDGISFEVFWSDIEKAYQGQLLSQDGLQYPDFTLRQLREHEEGAWDEDLNYWRAQYVQIPPTIPLLAFSLQPSRPKVAQFGSHTTQIRLDEGISDSIDRCSRMFKSTPFHFHLAVWQILLLRFFALEDICIGLGDGNRTDSDILRSMGLFLNLLPVKFAQQPSQSFGESLKGVRSITQAAFGHSRVPFDVILTELNVPRSASHNPLCQAFFNYRPKIEQSRSFCGCVTDGALLGGGETSFDLSLDVGNVGAGETLVHLSVQKSLYGMEHAEILLRSYSNLLKAFIQNPATRVSWPELHSKTDAEEAVVAGRGPELRAEWPMTIIHRLDEVALRYPNRVALKNEGGSSLTYAEAQRRINVIANELLNHGFGIGTRVGIFQSPGADWICSLIAILRTGGAYIPLDKRVGTSRLAMIMEETKAPVVLLDASTMPDYGLLHTTAQPIDVGGLRSPDARPVSNKAVPTQTAIIMYTSGSTGVPKGIMIPHSAYAHHVQSSTTIWNLKQGDETILHQSSYAWDASLWQIMASLCCGATLLIASDRTRRDPVALTKLIASESVTCTLATPTEYLAWFHHGRHHLNNSCLTTAVCGGEPLPSVLIREIQKLQRPNLKLINAYGPAEISVACSSTEVPYSPADVDFQPPPKALYTLPNYSVYIVDQNLNPVPFGVPGEVVIGGAGVAQGYLDDTKTSERFSYDHHASQYFQENNWTAIHRTGDFGKLNRDGGLVLLGRMKGDNQIKLRGIRINIEEIEMAIIDSSGGTITQAVASVRSSLKPDGGDQFIVAFVVMTSTETPGNVLLLLNRLSQELPLPVHMRPAAMIPVEDIPQNASGKIDRVAVDTIPIPSTPSQLSDDKQLTTCEKTLRQLWQQALPREIADFHSIDAQSDFFHIGGSSLALVSLQALIKDHFGVSMPLYQLFEASTLRRMSTIIQGVSRPTLQLDVDWNTETKVTPDLAALSNYHGDHTVASGVGIVVLTGATGFLGREILRGLIDDEMVESIHCVAIRKSHSDLPKLFAHSKVHVHSGDLGAPLLGLSEPDASRIFAHADIVIHNGADVSFMKTYQTLKLINVASTKELVKLALPRRIPFHFVSSAGVARLAAQESFGEISVASFPPPSPPLDGYIAAKWVSEVYLENVNRQSGLPVWIHRPSSITGTDAPELDLMGNVIRYTRETQKVPDSNLWTGVFDLISVQSVASQLLEAVHQSDQRGTEPPARSVRYLYESGEIIVGRDEIIPLMESGTGQQFKAVPLAEWVTSAEEVGMSRLLGEYLRRASDGQVLLPRLIKTTIPVGNQDQ
ncbi:hypothetical protein N7457_003779 [Penicillium paradoxum]|uniref:uncharacterized protein n=1 Tax=Penicillium paradoxum TaxID=176176 RepID=UPI0025476178|nr:uncharacterized protein N7457_003779 [Penicillium paradoxum]KAJ5788789.1 hypothetical protein N7457_003779 [Penicillium paradoxum]